VVAESDVFVLIAGFHYGSLVRDRPELSYTELELEVASAAELPRLVFMLDEEAEGPRAFLYDGTHGERQDEFRRRLLDSGMTVARVRSPDELETALLHALVELAHDQAPAQEPVWSAPRLHGDEVARPELADALVAALLAPDAGTVGVTTGLVGAGGFGKTTLARMVAHDPRVRARFADGVVWTTVGEDTAGPHLAARLVSMARLFAPRAAEVTDPMAAGAVLARAIGRRRVLLASGFH
jgi:hypothetical protein